MKDKIIDILKLFVLIYTMWMGFFLTYGVIWLRIGLPDARWAMVLLVALAGLSEFGYYRWLKAGATENG